MDWTYPFKSNPHANFWKHCIFGLIPSVKVLLSLCQTRPVVPGCWRPRNMISSCIVFDSFAIYTSTLSQDRVLNYESFASKSTSSRQNRESFLYLNTFHLLPKQKYSDEGKSEKHFVHPEKKKVLPWVKTMILNVLYEHFLSFSLSSACFLFLPRHRKWTLLKNTFQHSESLGKVILWKCSLPMPCHRKI